MEIRDRAALVGAALLVSAPALLPYHREPMLAFYQDALAFAFGLMAALSVLWPRRGESVPLPAMSLGLLGLAAVLALQVALGRVTFIETSATGILYVAWAALLAAAGARLREILGLERVAAVLQYAFAAGGFLLAITGFMQFYGVAVGGVAVVTAPTAQMTSATGQPNYLANILACAVASLCALAAAGRLRPGVAALAGVPIVLALALSASRGAWVFIAIIAVLYAAFTRCSRLTAAGLAAACLFALASWLVASGWLGEATPAAARFALYMGGSDVEPVRQNLGRLAWLAFSAQPFLGAGWGEFAWSAFQLAPDLGAVGPVAIDRHAHNLVLQLLAETGIAGAACVALPLAAWFLRTRPGRAEPWFVAVAAIHTAQAMVELPHWYAYLLGPFALVLGLGAGAVLRVSFEGWAQILPRAALCLAMAAGVMRVADYRALERWTAEAGAVTRAGFMPAPEMYARLEALRASAFAPEVEFLAAQLPAGAGLDAQLALNERALHVFPAAPLAARRVGLLTVAGRREEAAAIGRSLRAAWGVP